MYNYPDSTGHFGPYGGIFMAETLIPAVDELREQYLRYRDDPEFKAEFAYELKHYVGRPSPIYHAKNWSDRLGGAQLYLKREDLNHTGAHKINNAIGQALLAKRMGKKRVIAETGAGMHGVATATRSSRATSRSDVVPSSNFCHVRNASKWQTVTTPSPSLARRG